MGGPLPNGRATMADAAAAAMAPTSAGVAAAEAAPTAAGAGAGAGAPAPPVAAQAAVDNVERLQTLVTHHVELFERLLYVERDSDEIAKAYRGDRSKGQLYRHPSDMREDMPSDWHRAAIERVSQETGIRGSNRVKLNGQFSNCTVVDGETAAVHQMTDALSRNIFKELLDNRDAALATLSEVAFVVRDECARAGLQKNRQGGGRARLVPAIARALVALDCETAWFLRSFVRASVCGQLS